MSEAEQLASIDILDAHCAETVMLASAYQLYEIAYELEDQDVVHVRDQWRSFLMHDLGGVCATSIHDAVKISRIGLDPLPIANFITSLVDLAKYTPDCEIIGLVAEIVSCPASAVHRKNRMVCRGEFGECFVDVFEIDDPLIKLTLSTILRLFSELASLLPKEKYLRVKHTQTGTVAFADYELSDGLWCELQTGEESEFDPPTPSTHPWDAVVAQLRRLEIR